jgi:hypothetical protein
VPKKVGIAAAAANVGMLALTPLAFANDYDYDRGHGGDETASFSFRDDSVQQNQVNPCSSDQEADVLPSTVVGAILPSVSQEQNSNCVNIADGSGYGPTTTTPLPPDMTYTRMVGGVAQPGYGAMLTAFCDPGDTAVSFSVDDPGQIATGPGVLRENSAEVSVHNLTGGPQQVSITVVCEDTNPNPPGPTYAVTNDGGLPGGLIPAGLDGGLTASCNIGDTRLSFIVNDPAQIATGPVSLFNGPSQDATLSFANTTGSPQSLSIAVVCEDANT